MPGFINCGVEFVGLHSFTLFVSRIEHCCCKCSVGVARTSLRDAARTAAPTATLRTGSVTVDIALLNNQPVVTKMMILVMKMMIFVANAYAIASNA
ncbi:hypothetical protein [Nostoc sp. ChiSLP03a]|uniref:hypothetical protein n=1 Tax=Nostoc sp. ChiSLP03a TaxID=3075380 RepID=UPI002ADB23DE|nr:hypothetical protein [Nostoc sp. ChiSLP03a]